MKKLFNLLALLSIAALLFSCKDCKIDKNQSTNDSDKIALRNLKEVEWPKAYAENDTVLLDKILGDDFKMIDQSGNWYNKKDELEWIKTNSTNHDSFRYEIKRLDILENGTAIVCGTGHILKDSVKSVYESSNILVKRNGQWKAVLSHVSGVKEVD